MMRDASIDNLLYFPHEDFDLSLGDLRVLARLHVQRVANPRVIRLAAGMTNPDLVRLADDLGFYLLVSRPHPKQRERL